MKKILVTTMILMMLVPLKANAFSWGEFFRALFGFSTTTSVETLKTDVTTALSNAKKDKVILDANLQTAFVSFANQLSNESELKTVKSNWANAYAKTSESEKTTALVKVLDDYTTYLKSNKIGLVLIIKTMTDSEKAALVKDINLLSEYGQKYYELSNTCSQATSKAYKKTYEDSELNTALEESNKLIEELDTKSKAILTLSTQAKILGTLAGLKF